MWNDDRHQLQDFFFFLMFSFNNLFNLLHFYISLFFANMYFSLSNTYSLPGLVCTHISVQLGGDKSALRKSFKGLQSDKRSKLIINNLSRTSTAPDKDLELLYTIPHCFQKPIINLILKIMLLTDSFKTNMDGELQYITVKKTHTQKLTN